METEDAWNKAVLKQLFYKQSKAIGVLAYFLHYIINEKRSTYMAKYC